MSAKAGSRAVIVTQAKTVTPMCVECRKVYVTSFKIAQLCNTCHGEMIVKQAKLIRGGKMSILFKDSAVDMTRKGVWNDEMIFEWASKYVDPFTPKMVESGSLDLRLSNLIRLPNPFWLQDLWFMHEENFIDYASYVGEVDRHLRREPVWQEPETFYKHVLLPNDFVLLSSLEKMELLPHMTGLLVLKSTPGRLGLNHSHSGHGDPGFGYGNPSSWTFEVKNIGHAPYILEAGKSIIQLRIDTMAAEPVISYADKEENYNGQVVPTGARV